MKKFLEFLAGKLNLKGFSGRLKCLLSGHLRASIDKAPNLKVWQYEDTIDNFKLTMFLCGRCKGMYWVQSELNGENDVK